MDTSFSSDGVDVLPNEIGYCDYISLQADGKILAAGTVSGGTANGQLGVLVRYNTDGSLDNSFGVNGILQLDQESMVDNLEIQSDGKILISATNHSWNGSSYTGSGYLARLNSNGSYDASFDLDGKISLTKSESSGSFIMPQSDGKILFSSHPGQGEISFTRYNQDGSLDTSFDGDGVVYTNFNGFAYTDTMSLQSDGKILLNISNSYNNTYYNTLVRYNENGSLDSSFDFNGEVVVNFPNTTGVDVNSITSLSNGKIIIAGSGRVGPSTSGFALARYNSDGSIDSTFGVGGTTVYVFGDGIQSEVYSIKILSDGKILVEGNTFGSPDQKVIIARYNSDGSLDPNFYQSILPGNSSNITGTSSSELLYGFTGDDTINGVEGDDSIDGGAGNDNLNGGLGNDVAIYQGLKAEYTTKINSDGAWTITDSVISRDGTDILTNIEKIQFSDQLYFIPDTIAPTVSAFSPTDGSNNIAVSSDITVTFS